MSSLNLFFEKYDNKYFCYRSLYFKANLNLSSINTLLQIIIDKECKGTTLKILLNNFQGRNHVYIGEEQFLTFC